MSVVYMDPHLFRTSWGLCHLLWNHCTSFSTESCPSSISHVFNKTRAFKPRNSDVAPQLGLATGRLVARASCSSGLELMSAENPPYLQAFQLLIQHGCWPDTDGSLWPRSARSSSDHHDHPGGARMGPVGTDLG